MLLLSQIMAMKLDFHYYQTSSRGKGKPTCKKNQQMINWRRKKPFSSISDAFPFSWLSKFKQMRVKETSAEANSKRNRDSEPMMMSSPKCRGRFYSRDGDSFWRLSLGEQSIPFADGRKESVRSESDDKPEFPTSTRKMEKDRAFDLKRIRELPKDAYVKEKIVEIATPKLGNKKDRKLLENFMSSIGKIERKDCKLLSAVESSKHHHDSCGNAAATSNETEQGIPKLKEKKIKGKDLNLKGERRRKSLYISQSGSKIRVYSPRLASKLEWYKIKGVENMKKPKLKKIKKGKARDVEGYTYRSFESFAVVKSSYDPQQDFRDSMIEMMTEKKIRQAEELEELLGCYLRLNSDEYHDLIIKVFLQAWFDLKPHAPPA